MLFVRRNFPAAICRSSFARRLRLLRTRSFTMSSSLATYMNPYFAVSNARRLVKEKQLEDHENTIEEQLGTPAKELAKAASPEGCPFPCFRCKIKPCAKEAPSAVGLHSMPHLCRAAVDGHPCGIDPVPTPDGDSGDDDDDVDGDDTLGGKQSGEWFKDSIDKLDGMKSKD